MRSSLLKAIIISLVIFNVIEGQNAAEKNYYNWFDTKIGAGNTGLYNGVESKIKYRTINGNHKYFDSVDFMKGAIIYDGQPYYDVEMKYDIFNDEIIVKLPNRSAFIFLELLKEKIEKFTLNNKEFISLSSEKNDGSISQTEIFEMLYASEKVKLLQKHRKERFERLNRERIYSEFKYNTSFHIYYNEQLTPVKSKRDFIKLFPEEKKKINTFYGKRIVSRKSNYDKFLIQLMNYLHAPKVIN